MRLSSPLRRTWLAASVRGVLAASVLGVLAASVLGAPPALALTSDREQPIEIEADRAEADDSERVTIYRGSVVIVQGSLRIEGDTVWIHYDERDDLTKLVSVGRQAHFRQLPDGSESYRMAYADRLEYYKNNDLIVMLGNARYGEGKDQIKAERIVYDSRLARMKADTPPGAEPKQGGGRIRIKIVPKKKKPAQAEPKS